MLKSIWRRAGNRGFYSVRFYATALLFLATSSIALAQQASPTSQDTQPVAQDQNDDPGLSRRKRARVSRPAEFQGVGALQIEYGYNGDFKAQAFNVNQADTVTLLYNATATLQLQIDHDTFTSQTDPMGNRATASGDTHFFAQLTALRDTPKHPALALSWFTKFPTASTAQGLGSGRYDHKLIAQVSKEFGEYDVDFSAAVVVNGRPGLPGYQTGGQFALGVTRNYKSGVGLQAEIFGESIDSDEPRGKFALGAVSYQVNPRFAIDFGLRFGLNPAAPRFGVFGGVTFGLTNISRRKRR